MICVDPRNDRSAMVVRVPVDSIDMLVVDKPLAVMALSAKNTHEKNESPLVSKKYMQPAPPKMHMVNHKSTIRRNGNDDALKKLLGFAISDESLRTDIVWEPESSARSSASLVTEVCIVEADR